MGKGRQVGYARVQGTVRGPITLRQIKDQAVARQKRKLIRTLTLARQREAWKAWKERTTDKLTLGPQRRKVQRIKRRVQHPVSVRHDSETAGGPQPKPGCVIRPKQYIGQKPKHGTTRLGHGFCAGCTTELELVRGRIPKHVPGPPPYRECTRCNILLVHAFPRNAALRKAGGSYTQIFCPSCHDILERESVERGGTVLSDPDDTTADLQYDNSQSWS